MLAPNRLLDPVAGLRFDRVFSPQGGRAYDAVRWKRGDAVIRDAAGRIVFEQQGVELPASWSSVATAVVAHRYFQVVDGDREWSVRQLVERVVGTIAGWAQADGYFASGQDLENWAEELRALLLGQPAAFNSPVWFNVGVPERPQQSAACFITSVQDSMASILDLARTEGMIFKFGSGTGANLSVIRSARERVSGGGMASGPVSFMRGYDALAGAVRAGGVRRGARMVVLNADHPDILEFIRCKAEEERKAWALIDRGYSVAEAYASVQFQNTNHSVRVTDDFMRAVRDDGAWQTYAVTNRRAIDTYPARFLLREMAEAAWTCGDPGMQFDSAIQAWNCVPRSGRINATNPCSEFVFIDDTACNLLSLNLLQFLAPQGTFDAAGFRQAIDVCLTAQEILVSHAAYPTDAIARNSKRLRPLGLGYANLGALLMAMALPYDSEDGRALAAAITALMTAEAYAQSARMAALKGPFEEFAANRDAMLHVIERHRKAARRLPLSQTEAGRLAGIASAAWNDAIELGRRHGYRNAQATVVAPTGTTSLMMDCDTTGIEPAAALVTYRTLAGGGVFRLVNHALPRALIRLGYSRDRVQHIQTHVEATSTIEDAPGIEPRDLAIFDCALRPPRGRRCISPLGHLRMMAAVQPFVSGSISKTVILQNETVAEDMERIFETAWRLGLKSIAVYRDGSKRAQPLVSAAGPWPVLPQSLVG